MKFAPRQSVQFLGSILLAMCFGAGWSLAHVTTTTAIAGAEVDVLWLVLGSVFCIGAAASITASVALGRRGSSRVPLRLTPLGATLAALGAAEFTAPIDALVHADPIITTIAILFVQALAGIVCTALGVASVRAGIALLRGGLTQSGSRPPSFALPTAQHVGSSSSFLRASWARPPPLAA